MPPGFGPRLQLAIERSAAPSSASVALERLAEVAPDVVERLEEDGRLRHAVVSVFAASRSLTELCLSDAAARDVLHELDRRPLVADFDITQWKRLELLRIAARDLIGEDDLPTVGRALAEMAADVLRDACRTQDVEGLAVIAMGKFGAAELNYASDIDVMFVGNEARPARAVLEVARRSFRVDLDLRPEGRDGPLVRSLDSYEAYWDRWAQTWEFQALIKACAVAGDADLGQRFMCAAEKRLWERRFTAEDLQAVRAMKARSEAELARRGLTDREVKRGRGGIRDIEFAVQLLQLVHGHSDPALRVRATLDALAELSSAGYIDPEHGRSLEHAYRLLRTVEHRLQLVQEQQVHTLPSDRAALDRLARVMGYRDTSTSSAGALLLEYLSRQQASVRSIHERIFFRPLLDALTASPEATRGMSGEAVAARLAAFGFADVERTRQALLELTRGLTRSSRLMQQMLPLLLGWLSESPDPDLGLLGLRVLTSGQQQANQLAIAFRESPETARRLCTVLGTSRMLGETIEHHPDLIPALGHPAELALSSPSALASGAEAVLAWRPNQDDRQRSLLRFKRREVLRVAAADVLRLTGDARDPVVVTGEQLTALAEACLEAALSSLAPTRAFAVIAMGRFGGAELSYASDLDLLLVYDGQTAEHFDEAEKLAEALVRFLAGDTPAARIYQVDLDLRPEGKQGPLARTLEGYRTYYRRWGQTWERQALIRARPVAGDEELARSFMEVVEDYVWGDDLSEADVREIRRIKARVERERIPAREDPHFHLKLGAGTLSDVEFCVQLLQLRHHVRETATMGALEKLREARHLTDDDAEVLADAYRFCERTRNRWFLIKGQGSDALPSRPEQMARLARSLQSSPSELREDYRRVTRRCRTVVERLFYGKQTTT